MIEQHPFAPFLPDGCRVLFLGSFPPQKKRWCIDFFYPNFINDHWRIEGLLFFGDKNYFVDAGSKRFDLARILSFVNDKGIGYYDTATAVNRTKDNASDKYLEVVERTDVVALLQQAPLCNTLVTTGEKATLMLCETLGVAELPKVGSYITVSPAQLGRTIHLYRLPSSSRAYPLSLEKKAEEYRKMFAFVGLL